MAVTTAPVDQFGKPTGFGQGSPFTQTPKPRAAVPETAGSPTPAKVTGSTGTPSTSICKQFCSGQIQFFRDPGCDCSQFAAEPIAQTPQGVPQPTTEQQQASPPPATGGFQFQVPKGPSAPAPPTFVPGQAPAAFVPGSAPAAFIPGSAPTPGQAPTTIPTLTPGAISTAPLPTFRPTPSPQPSGLPSSFDPSSQPNIPIPTFRPGTQLPTFDRVPSEFEIPQQRAATSALLERILSEESLSPAVLAQLKESQKGTILSGAEQLRQQFLSDAARRGVSGGGAAGVGLRDIDFRSLGDISKSFRDIDIAGAATNRADQLSALQASRGFQQDLLQEFLAKEDVASRGAEARFASEVAAKRFGAEEAFKGFESEREAGTEAFQRFLAGEDIKRTSSQDAIQRALAGGEQALEFARFGREGQQLQFESEAEARQFQLDVEQKGADEAFRAFQTRRAASTEEFGRFQFGEEQGLKRFLAEQEVGLTASAQGLERFRTEQEAGFTSANQELERFLAGEEGKFAASSQALERFLAEQGLGFDFAQLGLQERQFLTQADLDRTRLSIDASRP